MVAAPLYPKNYNSNGGAGVSEKKTFNWSKGITRAAWQDTTRHNNAIIIIVCFVRSVLLSTKQHQWNLVSGFSHPDALDLQFGCICCTSLPSFSYMFHVFRCSFSLAQDYTAKAHFLFGKVCWITSVIICVNLCFVMFCLESLGHLLLPKDLLGRLSWARCSPLNLPTAFTPAVSFRNCDSYGEDGDGDDDDDDDYYYN